jgi:GDP-mannose 6-dehydrogenase
MIKYAANAFHALKVTFANEIGDLCDVTGADALDVMRVFGMDRQLNLSTAYLRPGFAYGGSCLPKDVRALDWLARQGDVRTPMLTAITESNTQRIARAIEVVLATGKQRVGVIGLAFKAGTDDIRESPAVAIVRALVARGRDVRILDGAVTAERLVGTNAGEAPAAIADLSSRLCADAAALLAHADVVVIARATHDADAIRREAACEVIDLTRGLGAQDV